MIANPNKALWEKGDFTRIAASMRESGEAARRRRWASRRARGARPRLRRRHDGAAAGEARGGRARRRHRREPRRRRKRASKAAASTNCRFQEGDACDLSELADDSFDLVVSIFGAMFAPRPFDVAKRWSA